MTDKTLRSGDNELAYTELGEGRTSVYLHGFTGNRETMADLADRIGGRRILVDLPGHGQTRCPDESSFSMQGHTTLLGELVEHTCKDPVDLIGYSMGARVALSFAVARPRRVRSLTLIGGSPGLESAKERKLRVVSDTKLAHMLHSEGIEAFVDHWMSLPMWSSLEQALGADGWERSRRQRLDNDPAGLAESLIGIGTGQMPPLHEHLPNLDVPVLLVVGELDDKFRTIANEMATRIPNAKVRVAGDAGHAVHAERPEATAKVIGQFVGPR